MRALLWEGGFLTRERVRLWSLALLAAMLIAIVWLDITAHGLNDYRGRPLGTDFSDVYAAGALAGEGHAAAAYDWPRHYQKEQAIFGKTTPFYGWHYPPFFLVAAEALAQLPYIPALLLWQGLTLLFYALALRALTKASPAPALARDPLWLALVLAFPAVFVNLTHGQNGFLTTAIVAGGLALLKPRPLLAGLVFGLLAYKPQFAAALPFALVAGRQWKALGTAAVMILLLCALATLSFGAAIWPAFFASLHLSQTVVLEAGGTGFEKIQSAFAALRLLGAPLRAAYGAQFVVTITALTALVMVWRSPASAMLKGAALCLATTLSTPYSLDYDLVLLAPVILLMAVEGRARGFRAGEHLLLAALWCVPILARPLASVTHLAVAPLLMLVALLLLLRRARSAF
ncbi:MAG: glycosyltransferase family 87 protein [Rhizomicrobium sp.]|nr:glycosyltransferase family 87 protein [Rhizomicrobium sp.]